MFLHCHAPAGGALATNHAGPGLHYATSKGDDSRPIPADWAPRLAHVPPRPSFVDSNGRAARPVVTPWREALAAAVHPWDRVGVVAGSVAWADALEACAAGRAGSVFRSASLLRPFDLASRPF